MLVYTRCTAVIRPSTLTVQQWIVFWILTVMRCNICVLHCTVYYIPNVLHCPTVLQTDSTALCGVQYAHCIALYRFTTPVHCTEYNNLTVMYCKVYNVLTLRSSSCPPPLWLGVTFLSTLQCVLYSVHYEIHTQYTVHCTSSSVYNEPRCSCTRNTQAKINRTTQDYSKNTPYILILAVAPGMKI